MWRRAYRAADGLLDLINWPFQWLGEAARRILGHCALVTMLISVGALALLPSLAEREDAVSFTLRKGAELRAARGAAGEHEAPERHPTTQTANP